LKAGAAVLLPAAGKIRFVNVVVDNATDAGFLTVYGDQSPQPTTSNVNYPKGLASSNTAVIPAGNGIATFASTDWEAIIDLQAEIS
jgi:hypothetical protein